MELPSFLQLQPLSDRGGQLHIEAQNPQAEKTQDCLHVTQQSVDS